jgi:RNA polymerase sigma-70 factor (ECF subfamily)
VAIEGLDIDAAWAQARAAHPSIDVPRDRFASHIAASGAEAEGLARHAADLYIVCACLAGDEGALAWLDAHVLTPAAATVRRIDASPGFVDEVHQRMRVALLVPEAGEARLVLYAARGPLRAWVGVTAVRTALMMRRSVQRAREVSDQELAGALAMVSTGNPELELVKRQYAAAFEAALAEACAALEDRLRGALRMHFSDGLSIDEIGAVYGVHRATAARWIQRASDVLFETTRERLRARLVVSPTELDRVAELIRSQIDVSLSQLLG